MFYPTPRDLYNPEKEKNNVNLQSGKDLKTPYIRKPHLTQRALKNHPGLLNLKKGLRR